jgi:hypothetical protein
MNNVNTSETTGVFRICSICETHTKKKKIKITEHIEMYIPAVVNKKILFHPGISYEYYELEYFLPMKYYIEIN